MSGARAELRGVTADEAGTRLDRWLKRHRPGLTQGVAEKWCRTGQVRVNGGRAAANARVAEGDQVRIPPAAPPAEVRPAPSRPPVDPDTEAAVQSWVFYRDEHVLALNKPWGLPVQGGPGISRHLDGMLDALRFGAAERPRLVHRLDRDTSGVMVVARTGGAAAKLAASFRGRSVEKTYWSVVVGLPVPLAGRIDMALTRVRVGESARTLPGIEGSPAAAAAATEYETVDHAGRRAAWLRMRPESGRTHQLRVHAASALQTPILGDAKYGGAAARLDGFSDRLHLHARALDLPHPASGRLRVEAPPPAHMADTFARLGFETPRTRAPERAR